MSPDRKLPANRQSWKIRPLPEAHTTLPYNRLFSAGEMARIRQGFIPQQMEEKWFAFCEDDVLHLHRSWTGSKVYEVAFILEGDGYRVGTALANRDFSQYTETDDETDAQLLNSLITMLLLR